MTAKTGTVPRCSLLRCPGHVRRKRSEGLSPLSHVIVSHSKRELYRAELAENGDCNAASLMSRPRRLSPFSALRTLPDSPAAAAKRPAKLDWKLWLKGIQPYNHLRPRLSLLPCLNLCLDVGLYLSLDLCLNLDLN